jgi:DNA-binding CsgD family transcriptional regulator
MELLNILSYLAILFLGLISILFSFYLYKTHRQKYLQLFLYYVVATNILGFFEFVLMVIGPKLGGGRTLFTPRFLNILYGLILIPFAAVSLYFFLLFSLALLGKTLSRAVTIIYAAVWMMLFLAFLLSEKIILGSLNLEFKKVVMPIYELSLVMIFLFAVLHLFINAKEEAGRNKRSIIKILGGAYLVYTAHLFINSYSLTRIYFGRMENVLFDQIFIFIPLIILYVYHKKYCRGDYPIHQAKTEAFPLFGKLNLSKREQEITRLIIQGKSNKEIERELYISIRTVENHVHNILQKSNVKSRTQLASIFLNSHRPGE